MQAVFFVAALETAASVACVDDVPDEPAGEPLALDSPAALAGLAEALLGEPRGLRPMRDATCRSFPVFGFSKKVAGALEALDDAGVEALAGLWRERSADALGDVDLYDLSTCVGALREALRRRSSGERLFVLLEEKAW